LGIINGLFGPSPLKERITAHYGEGGIILWFSLGNGPRPDWVSPDAS
jgi:hypothetical protein